MRKLFFTIAVLLCSVNVFGQYSYKDYFLNNIIVTDICFPTFGFGTTHEDATFYVGFEFTFFNAILGFGWDNEIVESEHWTKDVYVRPYTRVQNGKVVHVKGYYRARPNKKNDTSLSCCGNNIYTGYWFPCRTPEFTYIMDSKMWIAPIIGSTNEREDEFLWGLAFKFSGNYSYSRVGISVTFTNTFVSMGVSFCYH